MKCVNYVLLALCMTTVSFVQAETIDVSSGFGGYAVPNNSAAKFCVKLTFIKRNLGTLITGLTTAKIKPVRISELTSNPTTGQILSKPFNVAYTLAASTAPSIAGVYDFCMTPAAGTVWKKTQPLPVPYTYYVDAVVLGVAATDNGVFSFALN